MTAGHSIMGLSIGVLVLPRRWPVGAKAALLGTFAILGNVPDIPVYLMNGIYDISHSVFINGGAMLLAVLGLWAWGRARRAIGGWPVVIGALAAWGSHLLLDSIYNSGLGVQIFWPVSDRASLVLTLPWCSRVQFPWTEHTAENLRTYAVETLFYGGVLAGCIWIRRRRQTA